MGGEAKVGIWIGTCNPPRFQAGMERAVVEVFRWSHAQQSGATGGSGSAQTFESTGDQGGLECVMP